MAVDLAARLIDELSEDDLERLAERLRPFLLTQPEPWLTTDELAEHLRCSTRTILNYQKAGMPHKRHGTKPIYRASDCEAWLDGRGRLNQPHADANGAAPRKRPAPGHRKT